MRKYATCYIGKNPSGVKRYGVICKYINWKGRITYRLMTKNSNKLEVDALVAAANITNGNCKLPIDNSDDLTGRKPI